jgi:hypothetical protein
MSSAESKTQRQLEYIQSYHKTGVLASAIADGVFFTGLSWMFSKYMQVTPKPHVFPLLFGTFAIASGVYEHTNYVNTLTKFSDEPERIQRDYDMIQFDIKTAPFYAALGVAATAVLNMSPYYN